MATKCPICGYDNEDAALCCNLCQHIFRRENQPPKPAAALPYEEMAREAAETSMQAPLFAKLGIELDFSPASLRAIDAAMNLVMGPNGEAPGDPDYAPNEGIESVIIKLGSYFGEVCRRVAGGAWQKDPDGAVELVNVRVSFGANFITPIGRAMLFFRDGQKFAFFKQLEEIAAVKNIPRGPWGKGFLKQAELILDRGTLPQRTRIVTAAEFCKQALGYDPELAGEALVLMTTLTKMSDELAQAPAPDPKDIMSTKAADRAEELMFNGIAAFEANRLAEASDCFGNAVVVDPLNYSAWKNLAVTFGAAGQLRAAVTPAQRACELAPSNIEAWDLLAEIKQKLQQFPEEADCRKKITELAPGDAEAWRHRGLACIMAGRAEESAECFVRCLQLAPGTPLALLEKAVALDMSGAHAEALQQADSVLSVSPFLMALKMNLLKYYPGLMSKKMSPELRKLISEKLG
ncbi:MAG: hypothetical protein A2270_00595 [Elusimicrobia bacterium RIFOXYA12_FULL_51_18]|nr:MAG: hypothetical protein A2270_00595 [Elusimicrobia bacterium RIFOXYA12_FULL_51_18]OGS28996.1 MAG: hypothetical protein A2218_08610 [Elusimicrobia bacterium RIFOXYA2_FULL_53_38]